MVKCLSSNNAGLHYINYKRGTAIWKNLTETQVWITSISFFIYFL